MAPQTPEEAGEIDPRHTRLKRYDLGTSTDRIWRMHRASPFSDVAGALQEELAVLQDREKKLGALKASVVDGQAAFATNGVGTDATSALTSTIKLVTFVAESLFSGIQKAGYITNHRPFVAPCHN